MAKNSNRPKGSGERAKSVAEEVREQPGETAAQEQEKTAVLEPETGRKQRRKFGHN